MFAGSLSPVSVLMMDVRGVRMAMSQRLMLMFMAMRLHWVHIRRMFVRMVFVMHMPVRMDQPLVGVLMRMSLGKIQPHT